MSKVICFGEIMLRLNPEGYLRFLQSNKFEASYAGGEANVAVSLANYGLDVSFVTKLPDNDVAQSSINEMRKYGVSTDSVVIGGKRMGIYFVEKGASQRASKVIYDREYSSISLAAVSDFDWEAIFEGVTWFHFTGITPALGGMLPKILLEACKAAKKKGITISCDLNYRNKLWCREKAKETMTKLMPYVDVCISNEEDAADIFGIKAEGTDIHNGKLDYNSYIDVAQQLKHMFDFKYVAITLRGSISASDNKWAGMLYDGEKACFSTEYMIRIVDRVGGGDSFGGGLIYALINGFATQEAVDFATAAACLKHTIEHDFNLMSIEEVMSLVKGNQSGRVQR